MRNRFIAIMASAVLAGAALFAGGYALHGTTVVTHDVTRTHTVTRTITKPVTRWKTHVVTHTVTLTSGVNLPCAQQLWQAYANRAPVAANMYNVAGQTVPACLPYLTSITGG